MSHLDDLFGEYPEHLSVPQVAEVLGIKVPTAYKWLRDGVIPGYRVGKAWVVLRDEVKDAVQSGRNVAPDAVEEAADVGPS